MFGLMAVPTVCAHDAVLEPMAAIVDVPLLKTVFDRAPKAFSLNVEVGESPCSSRLAASCVGLDGLEDMAANAGNQIKNMQTRDMKQWLFKIEDPADGLRTRVIMRDVGTYIWWLWRQRRKVTKYQLGGKPSVSAFHVTLTCRWEAACGFQLYVCPRCLRG